jgi:protein-S-isoprenylcysteine O-methyltransferase Ste14
LIAITPFEQLDCGAKSPRRRSPDRGTPPRVYKTVLDQKRKIQMRSAMNAFKTLIFTVLVPGTVAVLIPNRLVSAAAARGSVALGSFHYVGVGLIVAGALIYLWCAWDFAFAGKGTPAPIDPPKELVVKGLYKYVRNPMYIGVLSLVLGQAIWYESSRLFAYAVVVFLLFSAFVFLYEEPALTQKFGDSYRRYCETVPRWFPRFGGWQTRADQWDG